MDPIALAAGTALVSAMATDGWQAARDRVVAVWRRARPGQAGTVDEDLVETRAQVLAARDAQEAEIEQTLVTDWQLRLQALMRADPSVADDLRRLLDAELRDNDARPASGTVAMRAEATGSGRVYQAGRDQHITER
ncbi:MULTISPECIES: hypothetical protein [Streptomyces]|uniref:hypothetical protein n=1 Tax=Streptomyces TaxID=1883 RepID=UPI000CD56E0C|nr:MULTISPECIES: hypothetical protein [unclassified Streptomyces]AWL42273.1 hypothetical protein B9S64_32455 [Streptomyces sp. SM18]